MVRHCIGMWRYHVGTARKGERQKEKTFQLVLEECGGGQKGLLIYVIHVTLAQAHLKKILKIGSMPCMSFLLRRVSIINNQL
mmetsp:Transcript_2330/g.4320  ORF Transcript_2330/g.4320 Transcript_2330/m.4320 type:complete len:82 (+) Transcript_2330:717-962(+)